MKDLDSIDRRILAELHADARVPLTTIATRVGRSRTAVQARIERLERDGVIRGYRTDLATGGGSPRREIGAILTIRLKDRLSPRPVIAFLESRAEVVGAYTVTGDADLIALLAVTSREDIRAVCEPLWALSEVRDTNTTLVLKTHVERWSEPAS